MKSIYIIIKFIFNHPFAGKHRWKYVKRFLYYQISKIFNPFPIVYAFTSKTKLIVESGMAGATGNIYCGLHEFEDMGFLLHFLRSEDLFVDIGANVGSYTVLASGHVGCLTKSFEPVPSTFLRLRNNIAINFIQTSVEAYNVAIGSKQGNIRITTAFDTVNHIQLEVGGENTIEVPVECLDDVLTERVPALIKIDVEGFETEVIKGAEFVLQHPDLMAIIIELNGSGSRYGFNEENIHQELLKFGYTPYAYDPFSRQLKGLVSYGNKNTIYIKDVDFAISRVSKAEHFYIDGVIV